MIPRYCSVVSIRVQRGEKWTPLTLGLPLEILHLLSARKHLAVNLIQTSSAISMRSRTI